MGFDPPKILSRIQLCFADADIDDTTIAALKASTEPVKLLFADGAQRVIELAVSVSGFTAALNESLQSSTAE